jgi:hypothetical protein
LVSPLSSVMKCPSLMQGTEITTSSLFHKVAINYFLMPDHVPYNQIFIGWFFPLIQWSINSLWERTLASLPPLYSFFFFFFFCGPGARREDLLHGSWASDLPLRLR